MANVVVYTTFTCPYCFRAKDLLEKKGAKFTEIDVTMEPDLREEMYAKANGRRTVPQVFINGQHIGGSDDLARLDRSGQLDALLAQPAA